jgi:hypothetical protein
MPNKLRIDTQGDQKSRLVLYDGKTFTLFARRAGFYATSDAPPMIGELIDVVGDKYGIEIPLLDLFLWGGPRAGTSEITEASDFGPADVGGITCEQYAFRQPDSCWPPHPLPQRAPVAAVATATMDRCVRPRGATLTSRAPIAVPAPTITSTKTPTSTTMST